MYQSELDWNHARLKWIPILWTDDSYFEFIWTQFQGVIFRILDQRKIGLVSLGVIYPVATYSEIGGDPKVNLPENMSKEKFSLPLILWSQNPNIQKPKIFGIHLNVKNSNIHWIEPKYGKFEKSCGST